MCACMCVCVHWYMYIYIDAIHTCVDIAQNESCKQESDRKIVIGKREMMMSKRVTDR